MPLSSDLSSLYSVFNHRKASAEQEVALLQRQSSFWAALRFSFFFAALVIVVYAANQRWEEVVAADALIFTAVFIWLVKQHKAVKEKLAYQKAMAEVNRHELLRLEWKHADLNESGTSYSDRKHPYAYDLDLFGKGSLFQWINRTVTPHGKNTLANWLMHRPPIEEVNGRQEACAELRSLLNWQQELQISGQTVALENLSIEPLLNWVAEPSVLSEKKWVSWCLWLLPFHFLAHLSAAILIDSYATGWPLLAFFINLAFIGKFNGTIQNALDGTTKALPVFKVYAQMMAHFTAHPFSAPWLVKRQQFLHHTKAQGAIHQLNGLLQLLDYRLNAFFALTVNAAFLLDIRWMRQLEQWKETHRHSLTPWVELLSEVEALNSLAATWHANPDFGLPEVCPQPFTMKAVQIGHPLIPAERRVCNDFTMEGNGKLVILSGSNMAGKSTFLRTLGINMVLAFAGGPVCAASFRVSTALLFTSMRIEDSLNENLSSFYAELTRLKQLFALLSEREDVFFLLDEILRGTNSDDRHRGVLAILMRLLSSKASGFISTHDLELAKLATEKETQVANFSFESTISNGNILFDYQLKEGICRTFNAYELMKNLGLVD